MPSTLWGKNLSLTSSLTLPDTAPAISSGPRLLPGCSTSVEQRLKQNNPPKAALGPLAMVMVGALFMNLPLPLGTSLLEPW